MGSRARALGRGGSAGGVDPRRRAPVYGALLRRYRAPGPVGALGGGDPAADRNGGGGRLGGGTPGTASGGLRVSPVALRVDADFADAGGAAAESRDVGGDAAGRCATACIPPAGTRCGATGGLAARDGERAGAAGGGDRAPLLCEMGLLAHPSVGADSPRVPAGAVDFSVPGSGGGIGVADAQSRS